MKERLIKLAKEVGYRGKAVSSLYHYNLWMYELQEWLRDKQDIHIVVHPYGDGDKIIAYQPLVYSYRIEEEVDNNTSFPNYELALEDALIESLVLLKGLETVDTIDEEL